MSEVFLEHPVGGAELYPVVGLDACGLEAAWRQQEPLEAMCCKEYEKRENTYLKSFCFAAIMAIIPALSAPA